MINRAEVECQTDSINNEPGYRRLYDDNCFSPQEHSSPVADEKLYIEGKVVVRGC